MFLGVMNTVFLNISNYLPHIELRNCSIQIVVLTNFVVISNAGIKRFDCTMMKQIFSIKALLQCWVLTEILIQTGNCRYFSKFGKWLTAASPRKPTMKIQWNSAIIRPPKMKTFCQLKTLFDKFNLFVSSFSSPSTSLIRDHLLDCPKVVFKTTFGQSQRWS